MVMSSDDEESGLKIVKLIPIHKLEYNVPQSVFVVYEYQAIPLNVSFSNTLKFIAREIDPSTGEPDDQGYDDEYLVEGIEIGLEDYVIPTYVPGFQKEWDALPHEVVETYALTALATLQGKF
jgi:coatomer protein complex subunit gamma